MKILFNFSNLSISAMRNPSGLGSIIRISVNHLNINGFEIHCPMGLVEWESQLDIDELSELSEGALPNYPICKDYHGEPICLGKELMYLDGFIFNPYQVFEDITFSHHSIWNVKRRGKIVASIEAGVMPVDGEDVVYVRRGEFLGVLTNHGNTIRGYETSGNPIRYLQTLHESGELI